LKIAHLSDLHLAQPHAEQRVYLLAAHLRDRYQLGEVDAVAVTGDLTDDSAEHEWAALERALAPLTASSCPLWLVPGNHDAGAQGIRWCSRRAELARQWIARLATPTDHAANGLRVWWAADKRFKVIGVDSCRQSAALARGQIGSAQLVAMEMELMDDVPIIVLLHHHPLWSDAAHGLVDRDELVGLLKRRRQVRAVLYGHRHVEGIDSREHGALWLASRKTTQPEQGALRWVEVDLDVKSREVGWTLRRLVV
jgi:3',5'-cyclic AMP phosphodiesterase CpdA